jgi:hypothetical protein
MSVLVNSSTDISLGDKMKLNSNLNITETNCNLTSTEFSIKASPFAFDILSSRLYANPVLAIVRELLTNAYDSQKAANNEHTPIRVVVPDYLNKHFSIRDYGLGLSKEDVTTMYTTFFSSTKSEDNNYTGGFGLGSKTPFAYTSSFSINSYFNGTKYSFLAVKKQGYPSIILVKEEATVEPNGLEITIPVNEDDKSGSFFRELKIFLEFIPEIKVNCDLPIARKDPIIEIDNIKFYERHYNTGKVLLKQGQNVYNLDFDYFEYIEKDSIFKQITSELTTVIEVPIGTVEVVPSREHLAKNTATKTTVESIIDKVSKIMRKGVLDKSVFTKYPENTNTVFDKLYYELLCEKYFAEYDSGYYTPKVNIVTIKDAVLLNVLARELVMFEVNSANRVQTVHGFVKGKKNIIIYCNQKPSRTETRKVLNMVENYEELKEVQLVLAYIPKTLHYSYICNNRLHVFRSFRNILFIANNVEELGFDIECVTFNTFKNKFPNDKKKRAKRTVAQVEDVSNKSIRVHRWYIEDTSNVPANMRTYYCGVTHMQFTDTIKYIKASYPKEYTLLVPASKDSEIIASVTKCAEAIKALRLSNLDFVEDYFKRLLNVDSIDKMYIIYIAERNMQYFSEYAQLNVTDFLEYLKNNKWFFTCDTYGEFKQHSRNNESLKCIKQWDSIVQQFKPKSRKIVEQSKLHDKLTKVKSVLEKTSYNVTLGLKQFRILETFMGNAVHSKMINSTIFNFIKMHVPRSFKKICATHVGLKYVPKTDSYTLRISDAGKYELLELIHKGG